MFQKWDPQNVFTKIINGEMKAEIIAEDEKCIAIKDINPKAKVHLLIIPKLPCADFSDFVEKSGGKTDYFWNFAESVIKKMQLRSYKLVANSGKGSGQVVFHFHLHLLSDDLA